MRADLEWSQAQKRDIRLMLRQYNIQHEGIVFFAKNDGTIKETEVDPISGVAYIYRFNTCYLESNNHDKS